KNIYETIWNISGRYELGWGGGTDGWVLKEWGFGCHKNTGGPCEAPWAYWEQSIGDTYVSHVGAPSPMVAGRWTHVAASDDGNGHVRVYVDGQLEAEAQSSVTNSQFAYQSSGWPLPGWGSGFPSGGPADDRVDQRGGFDLDELAYF